MTSGTNHNQGESVLGPRPPRSTRQNLGWKAATTLAVAAMVFLGIRMHQLSVRLSDLNSATQARIVRLNEQIAQSNYASNRRLESVAHGARDSAAPVEERARAEQPKTDASLAQSLREQQRILRQAEQQVAREIDALKQADSRSKSKLDGTTRDVSGVKAGVASAQSKLQQTGSDLKRVNGDMGVMSGLIATNSKELAELRELGERDYREFDLKRNGGMQKLGTIQVALDKADPQGNRFTLEILADDKCVEKRDRTINEPVQFYIAGNRQPYEIVVNEVKKDEVVGYLAVPKVRIARR
jgi:hypothetical protein